MFRSPRSRLCFTFFLIASLFLVQDVGLEMDKTITIEWEAPESITLLSEYTIHSPIEITSNQDFEDQGWPGNGTSDIPYVIENLNITSDMIMSSNDRCIRIEDTTAHFVIRNCIFRSNDAALGNSISLNNVRNGLIEQCIFYWQSSAIGASGLIDCYVRDNEIFNGTGYLFNLYYSDNLTIEDNTIYDCEDNVFLLDELENCTFFNNVVYNIAEPIFWLRDSIGCRISSNNFTNAEGFGIMLSRSHDCEISDNIVTDTNGLSIYRSDNNTLVNNTIHDTFSEGIVLIEAENCTLENNTLTDATNIRLVDVNRSIIKSNHLVRSTIPSGALSLTNVDQCNVTFNEIHESVGFGVRVDENSTQNNFVGNVFYLNPLGNAIDNGESNQWDDGISIGNTWDDYNGTGVYPIPGTAGSVDHYPTAIYVENTMTPTTPTSQTSPTSPTTPPPIDPLLMAAIGGGSLLTLIVVVVVLRKRGS